MTQSTKNNIEAMLTAIYKQEYEAIHKCSSTPMHDGMISALEMVNDVIEEKVQQYTAILDSRTSIEILNQSLGQSYIEMSRKREILRRKQYLLYNIGGIIFEMLCEIHKNRESLRR